MSRFLLAAALLLGLLNTSYSGSAFNDGVVKAFQRQMVALVE